MFDVNKGIAKIDGSNGKYNESNVTNPSVRYGRNAIHNFYLYLEQPIASDNHPTPPILDFGINPNSTDKNIEAMEAFTNENDKYLNSLPPLEYEYRYMPNIHKHGDIDKDALFGAAYEELGGRKEVSAEELNQVFAKDSTTTNPLDINNDGKIDVGEYSTSILAADMLSNETGNIDGTINNNGHNAVQELTKKNNAKAAAMLYSSIYNQFGLKDAAKNFNPDV